MVSWGQRAIRTPAARETETHLGKRLVGETFTQTMALKKKQALIAKAG